MKRFPLGGSLQNLSLWKVVLLAIVAVTVFQGTRGLFESTEGRYAECAREMLVAGNFLEPSLEFQPHWTKPPLTYWGIAGGMMLLGQNTWGARAFQILAFCLTVFCVYGLAGCLWGKDVAPYAALVYATSPFPLGAANSVNADTLLTLWESLALLCFWIGIRRDGSWAFHLMWLCLGGAFLTKGPPGLMPLLSILPIYWLLRKKTREDFSSLFPAAGILLFVLVGLGWYLFEIMTHEGLLQYWTRDEVVARIASNEFHRNSEWYKPFTIYGPVLIFGGLPWIGLIVWRLKAIPWPKGCWTDVGYWKQNPEWLFLLLSFFLPLLIFSLSRSRLPLYVLPLLVPLAVALGKGVHWLMTRGKVSLATINHLALLAVALVVVGKGVMAYRASPRNMGQLARAVQEARREVHGAHLYFVDDKPMYGLQFYLKDQFTRVVREDVEPESPSIIHVSQLPARIQADCSKGMPAMLLMARDQLGRIQEIFPPEFMQDVKLENKIPTGTLSASSETGDTGKESRPSGARFAVKEIDKKWALVFPCPQP